MIAKVTIILPFSVAHPENEIFDTYQFDIEGYTVIFYPFLRSEGADIHSDSKDMTINGTKATQRDVLQINFIKKEFERKESTPFDPPLNLIEKVANEFLSRLRYVTNAHQIKPINASSSNIYIRYLNDDESKLEKKEGFFRGRFVRKFHLSCVAVNNAVWADVHSIPPFQSLPIWKNLLLDASNILPDVGPSIVLTFTALEVFISKTLDEVAAFKKTDEVLWKWINDRGFF